MSLFDAAIVGGGPAGCAAARALARAGARVALIDGSHPREKPCGGGVTGRALELALPLDGLAAAGIPIAQAGFDAGGRRVSFALPSGDPVLHVFARRTFDLALLDAAIAAGATYVPARAVAFDRTARGWLVSTASGAIGARWLLGADGPSGVVRKRVFRPFARRQLSIAAGIFVDDVTLPEIVIRFVDQPRGYLWSFPRADHLAVGTCAQADVSSSMELQDLTGRWLDDYAPAAGRVRRRYAWPIPSLSAADLDEERPAGDGWMLLGDAAGLVDPITREGIYFALLSGRLAAAALASPDPARAYAVALRAQAHDELRRAARLKAAFFKPRFTALMVDALQSSEAIRGVMIDLIAGRQAYAGLKRRLLGTMELRLMMRLVRQMVTAECPMAGAEVG